MRVLGIIPARFKSSRFPGKPLVDILDKPLILWVCDRASKVFDQQNLIVATDDDRIANVVDNAGYRVILTSEMHPTGTDRLAEVAAQIESDIYVNIQGDEPLVNAQDIQKVIETKRLRMDGVVNAYMPLSTIDDPANVNIPKVLVNEQNDLVYISRLPIPGMLKNTNKKPIYNKQVCIYAFTKKELLAFKNFGRKGTTEQFEDIEILRFFELNIPIRMVQATGNYQAVDIPEDIRKIEYLLRGGA